MPLGRGRARCGGATGRRCARSACAPAAGASRGRSPAQTPVTSSRVDRLGGDGVGGVEDVVDVLGEAGRIVERTVPVGVGGARGRRRRRRARAPRRSTAGPSGPGSPRRCRREAATAGTVMWIPLAGRIEWGCVPLVEGADVVGPHAGGVDHDRGPDLESPCRPAVGGRRWPPGDPAAVTRPVGHAGRWRPSV